jgi:hypothetical protein
MPKNTKPKIAIASVDPQCSPAPDAELVEETRRSRGSGLPGHISRGSKQQVLADRQSDLLDTWEKEFGPVPQDAIEEIARLWPN